MKDGLDQYIDGVQHLPMPPLVIIKLMATFRESYADMDDVAKLLSQDPSLSAEILKRCNSGFFRSEEPIVDIFEAVMRMGYHEVYQAAVTMFSRKTLTTKDPIGIIPADELWRHSGTAAALSRLLALETGMDEGVAYTAGLLHDIGKMVLALAEGPKYAALMRQSGTSGSALKNAEQTAFGFDHAAVGARLLEKWNVASDILVPVSRHHDLELSGSNVQMAAIVSLANILAHNLNAIVKGDRVELPEAGAALHVLQFNFDRLVALARRAKDEIRGLGY
jgi:putative nucleotidyltransferase with HDIG domain